LLEAALALKTENKLGSAPRFYNNGLFWHSLYFGRSQIVSFRLDFGFDRKWQGFFWRYAPVRRTGTFFPSKEKQLFVLTTKLFPVSY